MSTNHNTHPDANLTLRAAFAKYVSHDMQALSEGTRSHYKTTLRDWERLTINPPVGDVTNAMLARYRDLLQESGLAPATCNQRLRYVRAIFRRLGPQDAGNMWGENVLTRVPGCRQLKVAKSWPRIATPEELASMYAAAGTQTDWPGPDAWPWRAFLVLAFNCGARKGDLCTLSREDVSFEEMTIRFIARKTGKAQCLPINRVTALHLQLVFREGGDQPFLWVGRKKSFSHAWQSMQQTAGIDPPFKPHTLRKTCATALSAFGLDIAQHVLGHSVRNDVTQDFYINPSDRIREAIDNLPQPAAFSEVIDRADLLRETAPVPPKRADWSFQIGHASYRGHRFGVPPTLLACLQLLVSASGPVTWQEFARIVWWSRSKVARKTVRTTLFQLRELLRRELRLPREYNPLPNQEKGSGWTITLPESEDSNALVQ